MKQAFILTLVCLGVLMIVLDTTIMTVALPSILAELGIKGGSLSWLINAYMLPFGGFLLVSGGLGDRYGPRRVFLTGLMLFTLASLGCGLASNEATLLGARVVQGIGGAVISAVSLSLVHNLYTGSIQRARAMGVYAFVCAAGGGIGDILGGVLTRSFGWHSIFLVNVPVGAFVLAACANLLPKDTLQVRSGRLDFGGALCITVAFTALIYALVNAGQAGWFSVETLGFLGTVGISTAAFVLLEQRVQDPLLPLRYLGNRNFSAINLLGLLWAAGTFAWFAITALYLQRVLGYDSFYVGLAFLPATLVMAVLSLGLSARIVAWFGLKAPLCIGLVLAAGGLLLFACAPLNGAYLRDVLPGMLLLGVGDGLASSPLLLAALREFDSRRSGLASGIVNTALTMGGAIGLAALASLASAHTDAELRAGAEPISALISGYRLAFLVGGLLTAAAGAIAAFSVAHGTVNTERSTAFDVSG